MECFRRVRELEEQSHALTNNLRSLELCEEKVSLRYLHTLLPCPSPLWCCLSRSPPDSAGRPVSRVPQSLAGRMECSHLYRLLWCSCALLALSLFTPLVSHQSVPARFVKSFHFLFLAGTKFRLCQRFFFDFSFCFHCEKQFCI